MKWFPHSGCVTHHFVNYKLCLQPPHPSLFYFKISVVLHWIHFKWEIKASWWISCINCISTHSWYSWLEYYRHSTGCFGVSQPIRMHSRVKMFSSFKTPVYMLWSYQPLTCCGVWDGVFHFKTSFTKYQIISPQLWLQASKWIDFRKWHIWPICCKILRGEPRENLSEHSEHYQQLAS